MNLSRDKINQLKKLCAQSHVDKLYLFGSVLYSWFKENSDIDFLVKFKPLDLAFYLEKYLSLKENLVRLVDKPVDLPKAQP